MADAATSVGGAGGSEALYVQEVRAQLANYVQLDELSENIKIQQDSIEHLLESPDLDIVSAILILGQLTLMQTNIMTASQTVEVRNKLDRLKTLRRETSKFHAQIADYRKDTEKFLAENTISDLEKDKFSFNREKLLSFISNMKNFFSDEAKKIKKAEEDFMNAVGGYFAGTGFAKIFDQLSYVNNALDAIDPSQIPSMAGFDAVKWVEQFAANLIYGQSVGITIPGTGEAVRGLYTIQTSLTDAIKSVTEAADRSIASVLERETDFLNLDTEILTDFLDSSMSQFNLIYQIMRLYYDGLLDIVTRLRV